MPSPAKPKIAKADLEPVYSRLKAIMEKFESDFLKGRVVEGIGYCLMAPPTRKYTKGMYVVALRMGKAAVSCQVMPIYAFPELLEGVSPQLRKCLQSKSCFTFKRVDEELFKELAVLTKKSLKRGKELLAMADQV